MKSIQIEETKTHYFINQAEEQIRQQNINLQMLTISQAVDTLCFVLDLINHVNTPIKTRTMTFLQKIIDDLADFLYNKSGKLFVKSLYQQFMASVYREKMDVDSHQLMSKTLALYRENRVEKAHIKVHNQLTEYVRNGSQICVFGCSSLVINTLLELRKTKEFSVIFATSTARLEIDKVPSYLNQLKQQKIELTLIPEGAVFQYCDRIDFFVVGAEAVTKDGGIINQLGTASLALIAQYCQKPLYVLTEFCKFSQLFIMTQEDLRTQLAHTSKVTMRELQEFGNSTDICYSDYTSPQHITLIFTDIGVFTPLEAADWIIRAFMAVQI